MLAVDVAAVRERHCAAAVSQHVASSLQRALRPTVHMNKVFDTNITLLANFVTAVDNSSRYEPTGLFFVIFVHFAVVK